MKRLFHHLHYHWTLIWLMTLLLLTSLNEVTIWWWAIYAVLLWRLLTLGRVRWVIGCLLIVSLCNAFWQRQQLAQLAQASVSDQAQHYVMQLMPHQSIRDETGWHGYAMLVDSNGQLPNIPIAFYYPIDSEQALPLYTLATLQQVQVTGELQRPNQARNFHVFDYRQYLMSQHIVWQLRITAIDWYYEKTGWETWLPNLRGALRQAFRFHSHNGWQAIVAKVVVNQSVEGYDTWQSIMSFLGISHLFAISGFHLYFMRRALYRLLLPLGILKPYVTIGSWCLLCCYSWLVGWPVGVIRVLGIMLLQVVVKRWDLPLSRRDVLGVVGLILLAVNPLYAQNWGYILSFCLSYTLSFCQDMSYRHRWHKQINTTVACMLVVWPLMMQLNHEWHPLQLVTVIVGSVLFEWLIFPLAWLTALCNWLPTSIGALCVELISSVWESGAAFVLTIRGSDWHIVTGALGIGWLLLLLSCALVWLIGRARYRRYIIAYIVVIYVLVIGVRPYLNMTTRLTIIDVGQGDALLYQPAGTTEAWLIDTGGRPPIKPTQGLVDRQYARKNIIPALKALGVNTLTGVIITHSDTDHIGNLYDLGTAIPIQHIWINTATAHSKIWQWIRSQALPFQALTVLPFDTSYVVNDRIVLWLNQITDVEQVASNDTSIAATLKLGDLTLLNLGDMAGEYEAKLVRRFPEIQAQLLKVAHHGSKYSTSEALLAHLRVQHAFISAGVRNRYGHPHQEVLYTLQKYHIPYLSTSEVGAIQLGYHPLWGYTVETKIKN